MQRAEPAAIREGLGKCALQEFAVEFMLCATAKSSACSAINAATSFGSIRQPRTMASSMPVSSVVARLIGRLGCRYALKSCRTSTTRASLVV